MARYFGRSWFDQWREPYWRTLWCLLQIEEAERIEALVDESRALRAAFRVNHAMWSPKELQAEQAAFFAKLREDPHAVPETPEARRERIERLKATTFPSDPRKVS